MFRRTIYQTMYNAQFNSELDVKLILYIIKGNHHTLVITFFLIA